MKKVLCLSLCFLIVLSSFVLTFAAQWAEGTGSPYILPVSTDPSFDVVFSNNEHNYYSASSYPVYVVRWNNEDSSLPSRLLFFSDDPNVIVYKKSNSGAMTSYSLDSTYNGYYFALTDSYVISIVNLPLLVADSAADIIDFIDSSVFSVSFDLSYLVSGSVSWLSSFAQVVKNNGLLLFFVLFIFVGVGIGLLNRFRKE